MYMEVSTSTQVHDVHAKELQVPRSKTLPVPVLAQVVSCAFVLTSMTTDEPTLPTIGDTTRTHLPSTPSCLDDVHGSAGAVLHPADTPGPLRRTPSSRPTPPLLSGPLHPHPRHRL